MKIAMVTGSRAEWGLLEPLHRLMVADPEIMDCLIVTGSHLSNIHGNTASDIPYIFYPVEMNLASDSPTGIAKTMAVGWFGFVEVFKMLEPEMIVVLGDRHETYVAASVAHVLGIPIAHIHGGEETKGSMDNVFRHSISLRASVHFVAHETYGRRVWELCRSDRIRVVGAIGTDGLEPRTGTGSGLLVVFNPATNTDENVGELLMVLREQGEHLTFILPGYDSGVSEIVRAVRQFQRKFEHLTVHESLPRKQYLELLSRSKALVGNSSSGIIEAPALGVPSINIGTRQKGRLMATSIINCSCEKGEIRGALNMLYDHEFLEHLSDYVPYKGENVAGKILCTLKSQR